MIDRNGFLYNHYYLRVLTYTHEGEWVKLKLLKARMHRLPAVSILTKDINQRVAKVLKLGEDEYNRELTRATLLLFTYVPIKPVDTSDEFVRYGKMGATQLREEGII